jgi:non-specific serine/threonine protein kinase
MHSSSGAPPAATSAVAATAPPRALTRLVGRSRELSELEPLLAATRLVTLTGTGGSGKSRLAAELATRFSDGRNAPSAWIELAACSDPHLVDQQVAASFSLRETAGRGARAALIELLQDRPFLLVLDNCEHLIESCAELAATLLKTCPRLTILATTREPLGVAGEQVWPVPPLALPTAGPFDHETMATVDAIELFVDRARAVDPSFSLTAGNVESVVEICRRLDGIPLAIELAAARIRLLSPEQMATRLEDRFALLSGGVRTAVARHRTLRATIDWSYALLTAAEQRLLERLAVFAGTYSLEAVEAVCSDEILPRAEILSLLAGLVDKSLVISCTVGSTARYSMLETIAHYAAERLADRNDVRELRKRHGQAYLSMSKSALPHLMVASTPHLERLNADRDNFRSALSWSIEHEPDSIGLPLAAALRWYWYYTIQWSEGVRWMTRALERASAESTPDRVSATAGAGSLCAYLGDVPRARQLLLESERSWRALGDERQLSFTLSALAQLLATAGDHEEASRCALESTSLARKSGISWDLGYCLTNAAAFVAQARGDVGEADERLAEAERIWAESRHPLGFPFVLNARALLALRRNDHPAAAALARKALMETRGRRDLWFS